MLFSWIDEPAVLLRLGGAFPDHPGLEAVAEDPADDGSPVVNPLNAGV